MPKISVIVPIYKVEPYLQRCVDSILAQTFQDFEIILIDDGSPDRCPKICDEYVEKNDRIHVIHQENGGLSAARNVGIDWAFENSDSEWLTFIDSDDWVYPQYLEFLYRAVKEKNVLISACGTTFEKEMSHEFRPQEYDVREMTSEEYWLERSGDIFIAWEKLYKKELFESIRFPAGMIYEDEFTTYKVMFAVKDVAVITNRLYIYYFSETSILRSNWNEQKFANIDAVLQQIEFFRKNGYRAIEKKMRTKLADVIKLDFEIIKKEPAKYNRFKKILEEKIEDSYKRQYHQLSALPFIRGWFLRRWIVWNAMFKIYTKATFRKIAKVFKNLVDR